MRLHAAASGEGEVADEVDRLSGLGQVGKEATIDGWLRDCGLRCHGGGAGVISQVHGEVEVGVVEVGGGFDDINWRLVREVGWCVDRG